MIQIKPGFLLLLLILFAFAKFNLLILGAILLSVICHELGHFIPALCFGVKVKEVGASFIGFYLRREPARSRLVEAVIVGGGLAVTLLIAAETRGAVRLFNYCLLLANAMPSPWSDGGRLLKALKRTS